MSGIEVLSGPERRRRWSAGSIVAEAFAPGRPHNAIPLSSGKRTECNFIVVFALGQAAAGDVLQW